VPSDRDQLTQEVGFVRSGIEAGDLEGAASRIVSARRLARAVDDREALREIRALSWAVWRGGGLRVRLLVLRLTAAPVVLRLLALLVPFLLVWLVYWFIASGPILGGNCGPEGLLGREGHLHGGGYESAPAAAVVGGVLWAMAGVAVWRVGQLRAVLIGSLSIYAAALLVLWFGISPIVWGDQHCVL
jgi:hypothetical protein